MVDEVLERDRQETRERSALSYYRVALFVYLLRALIRPQLWGFFDYVGRAVVATLFVIGVWHLGLRLRDTSSTTLTFQTHSASLMSQE